MFGLGIKFLKSDFTKSATEDIHALLIYYS